MEVKAACAEGPRTAASSRRDAVSVCAWAEDNPTAAANVTKQSGGRSDCGAERARGGAQSLQHTVDCTVQQSNGCRRDRGRWRVRAPQMEGG